MYNVTFRVSQKLTQEQLDYLGEQLWFVSAQMIQKFPIEQIPDRIFTELKQRKAPIRGARR